MKIGEVWYYAGGGCFRLYNHPSDYDYKENGESLNVGVLEKNECFTILHNNEESPLEYQLCIFFNNQKWYFEVAKSSIKNGIFKKL